MNSKFLSTILCGLVCVAGCGGGSDQLKVVPVGGIVRYQDKPVADAEIVFYPEKGPAGVGRTDSNGAFVIKTNGQLGGTVGKNKVTVGSKQAAEIPPSDGRAIEFASKSSFSKKYSDQATTDLVIEITSSGNKELKLDLTD